MEDIKAIRAKIDSIRGSISTASEMAAGYANPHPPASIIKARVEAEIESLRAAALDRITLGYAGAAESNWRPGIIGQSLAKLTAVELIAILEPTKLARLLIEAGEQEAAQAEPAFRLTAAEAKAALAAKEAELVMLEAQEEGLIRLAETEGITIQRRASAMPGVVLAPDAELAALLDNSKVA